VNLVSGKNHRQLWEGSDFFERVVNIKELSDQQAGHTLVGPNLTASGNISFPKRGES
jgi:hypothetical protein